MTFIMRTSYVNLNVYLYLAFAICETVHFSVLETLLDITCPCNQVRFCKN